MRRGQWARRHPATTRPAIRHATPSHTYREMGAPVGTACVMASPPNSRTAKPMPIGMPMRNSCSTSRRSTTAMTQTASVTQNKATGNQPAMIEMLPTFTVSVTITATTTTTATAHRARTHPRGRNG